MNLELAYGIMVFYGLILVVSAAIGNYLDKKNGFTYGFVFGSFLNLFLWFSAGKRIAQA
tara:strand:- start:2006 stop:2182 length:177 start_codon:yes stop_codon:yes gene_type:complete